MAGGVLGERAGAARALERADGVAGELWVHDWQARAGCASGGVRGRSEKAERAALRPPERIASNRLWFVPWQVKGCLALAPAEVLHQQF